MLSFAPPQNSAVDNVEACLAVPDVEVPQELCILDALVDGVLQEFRRGFPSRWDSSIDPGQRFPRSVVRDLRRWPLAAHCWLHRFG